MSCGVGYRRSLDPVLLWLWCTAMIRPLAWEPPYAAGVALKRQKKKKKRKKKDVVEWMVYDFWDKVIKGTVDSSVFSFGSFKEASCDTMRTLKLLCQNTCGEELRPFGNRQH